MFVAHIIQPMDTDPLALLSEKESKVMDAVLQIIEANIDDKELRDDIIGMVLVTIEEWGKKRLEKAPTSNPQ